MNPRPGRSRWETSHRHCERATRYTPITTTKFGNIWTLLTALLGVGFLVPITAGLGLLTASPTGASVLACSGYYPPHDFDGFDDVNSVSIGSFAEWQAAPQYLCSGSDPGGNNDLSAWDMIASNEGPDYENYIQAGTDIYQGLNSAAGDVQFAEYSTNTGHQVDWYNPAGYTPLGTEGVYYEAAISACDCLEAFVNYSKVLAMPSGEGFTYPIGNEWNTEAFDQDDPTAGWPIGQQDFQYECYFILSGACPATVVGSFYPYNDNPAGIWSGPTVEAGPGGDDQSLSYTNLDW